AGETRTKRRRKPNRAPKDPNAPKRPPSTFLMYCSTQRSIVHKAHPEWPYTQIAQELAKLWKNVPEEEKRRLDNEYRRRFLQWKEDIAQH
ncbi:high mobility group box domain-containing protein, partial [Piptocephalis cylindrospora]